MVDAGRTGAGARQEPLIVKPPGLSVCLFCGSSNAVAPAFLEAAAEFGRILARERVRLVYGGGGIGLMGAAAKAALAGGGAVLGVIPGLPMHPRGDLRRSAHLEGGRHA
ncbi:hypothetical protein [Caulobacter sp. S45]|uniref:SLOG cluster 4 domain-containing protein n=1 Tax=Caulobacter sp. S45 TaxID=1641861 RepID=UPI00352FF644